MAAFVVMALWLVVPCLQASGDAPPTEDAVRTSLSLATQQLQRALPAEAAAIRANSLALWGSGREAQSAVRYFAGLRAGAVVMVCLEHPHPIVVQEAARAAMDSGAKEYVPPLLGALRAWAEPRYGSGEAPIVWDNMRGVLLAALSRTTGQDYGPLVQIDWRQMDSPRQIQAASEQVRKAIAEAEGWLKRQQEPRHASGTP